MLTYLTCSPSQNEKRVLQAGEITDPSEADYHDAGLLIYQIFAMQTLTSTIYHQLVCCPMSLFCNNTMATLIPSVALYMIIPFRWWHNIREDLASVLVLLYHWFIFKHSCWIVVMFIYIPVLELSWVFLLHEASISVAIHGILGNRKTMSWFCCSCHFSHHDWWLSHITTCAFIRTSVVTGKDDHCSHFNCTLLT